MMIQKGLQAHMPTHRNTDKSYGGRQTKMCRNEKKVDPVPRVSLNGVDLWLSAPPAGVVRRGVGQQRGDVRRWWLRPTTARRLLPAVAHDGDRPPDPGLDPPLEPPGVGPTGDYHQPRVRRRPHTQWRSSTQNTDRAG
jgi:hypothetical protein